MPAETETVTAPVTTAAPAAKPLASDAGVQKTADMMKALQGEWQPVPEGGKPKEPEKAAETITPKPDEAKPTPETKPETKPAQDESKWPRSAKEWKNHLETHNKLIGEKDAELTTLKTKLADLEQKMASAPSPEIAKKVDELEKERNELSEQLRITNITEHPKFKAYYENKLKAQVDLAKRIVGTEKATEIETLLRSPDSEMRTTRLEEMVNDLAPFQQNRMGAVINSIEEISAERSGEIERAKTDYERIMSEQKTTAEKTQAEMRGKSEKLFSEIVSKAQGKEGLSAYQMREGDKDWNESVSKRIDAAKQILFGQNQPETLIYSALAATALPAVLKSHQNLFEENAKLKAQVESLSKATPSVAKESASSPGEGAPQGQKPKPGQRPMDVMQAWVKGTQAEYQRP